MTACNAVLKSELKSETSFKLCSNIISGATAGLVYARNGPLQQVLFGGHGTTKKDLEIIRSNKKWCQLWGSETSKVMFWLAWFES